MFLKNKTILAISPYDYFKKSHGAENRIFYITEYLARETKLYSYLPLRDRRKITTSAHIIPNYNYSRPSRLFNIFAISRLCHLISKHRVDFILANTLWAGPLTLLLSLITNTPFIFDDHNIEYLRFSKKIYRSVIKMLELTLIQHAHKVILVSEEDKEYIIRHHQISSKKIFVLPNGYEETASNPSKKQLKKELKISAHTKIILFLGNYYYAPNVEALQTISEKINPLLKNKLSDYRLVLTGRGPISIPDDPYIIKKGFVPNIDQYIKSCDIVIAPLSRGHGTKLKIIESIGCGKTVITTPIGAKGIQPNNNMIVELDWPSFVDAICKNLDRKDGTPHAFREYYQWKNSIKRIL